MSLLFRFVFVANFRTAIITRCITPLYVQHSIELFSNAKDAEWFTKERKGFAMLCVFFVSFALLALFLLILRQVQ